MAIISRKRPELVAPMLSHLEVVSKLQQRMGGMAWCQFDWKARCQLCVMGSTAWGAQNPLNLFSYSEDQSSNDPLDIVPPSPAGIMQTGSHPIVSRSESTLIPTVSGKRRSGVCPLFNRAPAGCPYGETCKFIHRCSSNRPWQATMPRPGS